MFLYSASLKFIPVLEGSVPVCCIAAVAKEQGCLTFLLYVLATELLKLSELGFGHNVTPVCKPDIQH